MNELDRDKIKNNGWRFGVCFSAESAPDLFVCLTPAHKDDAATYIVATHDCSLVDPRLYEEPYLEYFVARPVSEKNGNFTFAKNIRCLHLDLLKDGALRSYELKMAERGFIDRAPMDQSMPDSSVVLTNESKRIFARWIANRYTTRGFPDEFNRRINAVVEGKKACLKKLFSRPESRQMLGVYIKLTPPDQDLPGSQSYRLVVTLVYEDAAINSEEKRDQLDDYAKAIKECLSSAQGVVIEGVIALSEKDISLQAFRRLQQWQWDYVSMRESANEASLIEEDLP